MTISEPATLVTDYLLAIFTAALAWRLCRATRSSAVAADRSTPASDARWWWAVAFSATAAAGVTGGTVHGFQHVLGHTALQVLWLVTIEAIVFASFAVVAAAICAARLPDGARHRFTSLAGVICLVYGIWIAGRPEFAFAIAAYGTALAVLVALQLSSTRRASGWRWMVAGVAVSVVAAVVQQSGWALHRHFNHNDLFHVIQALSVWLLYRGAVTR